ncbi:lysophospholipid acyltransferase family protein [Corynebacterium sp. UBA2622]|uniref:lysophospholipid acyltransferase family protein n=1 Tax=Corynebacterium sp. UBA2622 TaxID=1946393 RepID=UPI0025BFC676|nr:lysophospholipid acyltransferase family protein [Corynebacterium sp. UBA2622]
MTNYWYTFFKATIGPPLFLWNRPTITGAENIPKKGAALLVSNHEAVMDSFYLPLMVWRQMTFPAKKEYFTAPGVVGRVKRFFFSSAGQIAVDRSASGAGDALRAAAKGVLDRGELMCIYPEGTRSPDGRIYRGRTGVARIAMENNVPVVPLVMIGSREANPIGTVFPRPRRVHIRVGEAIDPHAWARENGYEPSSREVMRPFTDYVMSRLVELSGNEYVDMYASEVKKSLEAGEGYPAGAEPAGR